MHTVKFLTPCLLLLAVHVQGQSNTGRPFYDFMTDHYTLNPVVDSVPRSGHEKMYDRAMKIWAPRLWPHGDFSIAAESMGDHVANYAIRTALCPPAEVEWEEVGKPGQPSGTSGARGTGQVHRITFDPGYDGVNNTTIYAATAFGGLWRTDDDGDNWHVVNTDDLPLASASDVAISHQNTDHIFMSTGYADGGLAWDFGPNGGGINPFNTIGIYRSIDRGVSWNPINGGSFPFFESNSITRRIIIDPTDENNLYVATSAGVFRSQNAMAEEPSWLLLDYGPGVDMKDTRGLEFKPGDASTIYASTDHVYRRVGEWGDWQRLTGPGTGLDFDSMPIDDFIPIRTNIGVTLANSEIIYAYVIGYREFMKVNRINGFIYKYEDETWTLEHHQPETSNVFDYISPTWMAFAISPIDPSVFYFGHTRVRGNRSGFVANESAYHYSNANQCHADIHCLVFEPVGQNPKLWAGHDGGISVKNIQGNQPATNDWTIRNEGLGIKTIWDVGSSGIERNSFVIGNQDTGLDHLIVASNLLQWNNILGGDGFASQMLYQRNGIFAINSNDNFNRFDSHSGVIDHELNYRLFDPYETNSIMGIPKPWSVVEHPDLSNPWMGFTEILERRKPIPVAGDLPEDVWRIQSDIHKTPGYQAKWKRGIQMFVIAESDPHVIYATQGGFSGFPPDSVGNPADPLEPGFWRSTSGGNDGDMTIDPPLFTNLAANLPDFNPDLGWSLAKPVITGIAVDPRNANRVWVSFTGYDPALKVYRSDDGGMTWVTEDPELSLANLPVNGIAYQSGTDDRLFIGTDAGVYYKDSGMTCWAKYGNIPNVRVVKIRIIPCSNEIIAATFGRGLWRAALPPPTEGLPHYKRVVTNELWDEDMHIHGNVLVRSGVTLTITSTVHFPAGGALVVEPGARLELDGAVLTNGCAALWNGVLLQGNGAERQSLAQQAYLVMRSNARIEHARVGVLIANSFIMPPQTISGEDRSGGFIHAFDGEFRNNQCDVVFSGYENFAGTPQNIQANRTEFNRCTFSTQGGQLRAGKYPADHVRMTGVRGIKFRGCTWTHDQADLPFFMGAPQLGTGIHAINSTFTVANSCSSIPPYGQPCPQQDVTTSLFTGLHRGVLAVGFDPSRTFSIDNATFTSTHQGIRMEGVQDASITRSSFAVPSPMVQGVVLGPTYGIYSDQCTGYRIQENSFHTTQPGAPYKVGLIIKDSGPAPNTFYNNTFDNLHAGSIIQGNNATALDLIGLEVKCNDYGLALPNDFDVALTGGDVRVQRTQGQPITIIGDPAQLVNPAGNRFSLAHNGSGHPEEDWHVQVSATLVEYFHHVPVPNSRTRPDIASMPDEIIPIEQSTVWPEKQIACPSLLADERTREERRQMAEAEDDELGNAKGAYDATKDNGDTHTLLGYVSDAAHSSAQVRNALQSVAPRVSAEVWVAAFERTVPMSAWHITQALLSNSPLQAEVMRMVQHYALPSAYAELVYAAQDGEVNVLTLLQSSMAKHAGRKAEALADLGRMAWLDSLELGEQLDGLVLLHQQLPAWNSALAVGGALAAKGEHGPLLALAQQAGSDHETPALYALLEHYAQAQQAGGWADEASADVGLLQQLGAQREVIGSAYANAWLHALGYDLPEEIIILPGDGPKSAATTRRPAPISWAADLLLEAYPNPSSGVLFVVYEVPDGSPPGQLRLLDLHGRTLFNKTTAPGPGMMQWNVQGLTPGLYLAELRVQGLPPQQVKVAVQQ